MFLVTGQTSSLNVFNSSFVKDKTFPYWKILYFSLENESKTTFFLRTKFSRRRVKILGLTFQNIKKNFFFLLFVCLQAYYHHSTNSIINGVIYPTILVPPQRVKKSLKISMNSLILLQLIKVELLTNYPPTNRQIL